MTKSKKVIFLLFTITCLTAFTGCDNEKIPSNSYRVEIEDVFEMSNFILKKLTITTAGTRWLHIQLSPGNEDILMIEPVRGSKYSKATVFLAAEKVSIDNKTFVFLRYPITTRGTKMSGSSARIELFEPVNLEEEFELMLESGVHPTGQTTDFARIHDRTYSILVN